MVKVQVKNLSNNTLYSGRTHSSIVRRVWGRRATLMMDSGVRGRAQVVKRDHRDSCWVVLASVFLYD